MATNLYLFLPAAALIVLSIGLVLFGFFLRKPPAIKGGSVLLVFGIVQVYLSTSLDPLFSWIATAVFWAGIPVTVYYFNQTEPDL